MAGRRDIWATDNIFDGFEIIKKLESVIATGFNKFNARAIWKNHAKLIVEVRTNTVVAEKGFRADKGNRHLRHVKTVVHNERVTLLRGSGTNTLYLHDHASA